MQFREVADAADPQMHVRRRVLAFDLVGFSPDQHRQHIAPSQDRVHLYVATVQSATPACLCPLEFEAVAFTVDGDVVDHKKLALRVDVRLDVEKPGMILLNPTLLLLPLASNSTQQFHWLVCSQLWISFHCRRRLTPDPRLRISRPRWLRLPHLRAGCEEAPTSTIDPGSQCLLFQPESRHRSECGGTERCWS